LTLFGLLYQSWRALVLRGKVWLTVFSVILNTISSLVCKIVLEHYYRKGTSAKINPERKLFLKQTILKKSWNKL
jgi:hypothetical protein